jgi:hypothetical protein
MGDHLSLLFRTRGIIRLPLLLPWKKNKKNLNINLVTPIKKGTSVNRALGACCTGGFFA